MLSTSKSREDNRILITGGGPVGLFAAIRLTGFGIPVTLVEKNSTVSQNIRASTIHPPSLEMMAPYGINDEVFNNGLKVSQWQVRNHITGENVIFDLKHIADETEFPYRVQCEQSKLCEIMNRLLKRQPLADIRYSTELLSATQDKNGVTIKVVKKKRKEELKGRFLIAADGGTSTIRGQLRIPFEGSTYPERTVLVTTPFPFHKHIEGLSSVTYCWQENGNFSLLQLPNQWRASLYFPEELSPEEALSEDRIQQQLHEIYPSVEPFTIYDKRVYRVHQRIVPKYNHGRILLAGDAAHLNSPSGGMGMNGGLHDAHNLTEKLNKIWSGGDLSLLDLYSRQRKPIAERQIIEQADQNRKRMTERDPTKRRKALAEMRAITEDPVKCKSFLMKSSMIEGLREADLII